MAAEAAEGDVTEEEEEEEAAEEGEGNTAAAVAGYRMQVGRAGEAAEEAAGGVTNAKVLLHTQNLKIHR